MRLLVIGWGLLAFFVLAVVRMMLMVDDVTTAGFGLGAIVVAGLWTLFVDRSRCTERATRTRVSTSLALVVVALVAVGLAVARYLVLVGPQGSSASWTMLLAYFCLFLGVTVFSGAGFAFARGLLSPVTRGRAPGETSAEPAPSRPKKAQLAQAIAYWAMALISPWVFFGRWLVLALCALSVIVLASGATFIFYRPGKQETRPDAVRACGRADALVTALIAFVILAMVVGAVWELAHRGTGPHVVDYVLLLVFPAVVACVSARDAKEFLCRRRLTESV